MRDAWVLDLERREDDRGFFARAWCRQEFQQHGLAGDLVQANIAATSRKATIRGLHYQAAPWQESKLVRCVRGAIWDVIVDLRPGSDTYLHWFAVELTADNHRQMYVPKDFAHGYQTLVDGCEVFYHVSTCYAPEAERGLRWDDPSVAIRWPMPAGPDTSMKDRGWPDVIPGRQGQSNP